MSLLPQQSQQQLQSVPSHSSMSRQLGAGSNSAIELQPMKTASGTFVRIHQAGGSLSLGNTAQKKPVVALFKKVKKKLRSIFFI